MHDTPTPLQFDVTQIEDSVGYLMSRSRTMVSRSIDAALSRLGVTHAQGSVFMMLHMQKCSTAAELARDLFIDSAAMKRTLDKMAEKGWITRVADLSDKRLFRLELTEAGQQLAVQLPPIFREVMDVALTGFTQEELGFLKCLLRKLLANRDKLDTYQINCSGNQ
ncbi:MarR family winged helix-turn-helix transcriptional regulator [Undibacterium curvum]|jgi:DNA-binding MarR family transcriptional regulator|uniref:MarR family transcriptional regulator n=1 Tax=Undibacterium curvum TaxID=2762294 RepID=A0ABR7A0U6_9BURK|nr:MarR family transcriptional regulator [Undibacterium curvum]MBC3930313.1 MarR family transcriptional regulator [Undibacterium curvum]